MSGLLASTRTVMRQRPTEHNDRVLFRQELDEPGVARGVSFAAADWHDMGEPGVITVTIEPGDRLNT